MIKLYAPRLIVFLICLLISPLIFGQVNQGSPTIPFGSNKSYQYGIMPTNASSADAESAYNDWVTKYVEKCNNNATPAQYRVKFDEPANTVSEGIGYGMLLAAYAADKTLFDGFWSYYKAHSTNGLMDWKISGCSGTIGSGPATDAELDAALALLVAETQWPNATAPYDYLAEAKPFLDKIKSSEMDPGNFQANNGANWGNNNDCRNPSYQAPAYYKVFATVQGQDATFWGTSAVKGAYDLITANDSDKNGLVSDWSTKAGSPNTCQSGSSLVYGNDACRNPWRMATDVIWWNDSKGNTQCNYLASYLNGKVKSCAGPVSYTATGGTVGTYHNSIFVSTFAAGLMGSSSTNQTLLNDFYNETKLVYESSTLYFGNTLRVISLFMMTGNFWKPGSSPTPEINVKQGTVNLPDDSNVDLGNVTQGTSKQVTLTIQNLGAQALTISGITFTGTDASKFSVSSVPASIAANGSADITLTITPGAGVTGALSAVMNIANNDPTGNENPYTLNLSVLATQTTTAPEINVKYNNSSIASGNSPAFSLGYMTQAARGYFTFTIENTGSAPLTISSITVGGAFSSYGTNPTSVPAGGTATFNVTILGSTTGVQTGSVTITNDDSDEGTYTINYNVTVAACATTLTNTKILQDYEENNNLVYEVKSGVTTLPKGPWNTTTQNPAPGALNSSPIVASYTRRQSDGTYDQIRYLPCGSTTFDVTTTPGISILVYSPKPGVQVKLSCKKPDGTIVNADYSSDINASTTKTNQWEKLFFDLTPLTKNTATPQVGIFDIMIDAELTALKAASATTMTFYLDEIRYENTPCLTDLPTSEMFLDYDAHNNLTYQWTTAPPTGVTATSSFSEYVTNPSKLAPNTSDNVAKFVRAADAKSTYQGVRYAGCKNKIDLSGKTAISMLVYSGAPGITMQISLINSAGTLVQAATAKTTKANAWEKLYFDFSALKGNTTVAYMDIYFDPTYEFPTSLTYYIDEIKYDIMPCPPVPTITAGGQTTFCSGGSVVLTANSTVAATAYEWSKDGVAISAATTATYTATASGSYTVKVTAGGCQQSSTATTVVVNTTPAVPTITAGGPVTFCTGGSVVLTGASTTAGVTYQWYKDGSAIATGGTDAAYTANASGVYTVKATATTGGCSSTSTGTTVTLNPTPAVPTITASGAASFCTGGSVVLTGASTTAGVTYQWSKDGSELTSATSATYTATEAGSYTVTAKSGSCTSTSAATTVTVNPKPVVTATTSTSSICVGSSTTLTASAASGTAPYTYSWTPAANLGTPAEASTTATPTAAGTANYSVAVTDSKGCSATASVAVTVTSSGTAGVQISASPAGGVCEGSPVTFTATPSNGGNPTYQWKVNGVNSGSNDATFTGNGLKNGDKVSVVMTSSISCVSGSPATSNEVTVTINANPSVTATAASASVCDGESTTITATATGGTAPYTYAWTPAAGLSSTTVASPTVVPPSTSNTYSVVVKDSKGCSSAAANVTVAMTSKPAVTASAATPNICTGSSTTLTANAVGGTAPYSYTWSPSATLSSATDAAPTATPTTVGANVYSVVVKDTKGCSSASANVTVTVTSSGAAGVQISASPAGGVCEGSPVSFTATPTNGGSPSYQWKVNGVNSGSNEATFTGNGLKNGDKVSVVMTSSISCVSGSPATSNEVTVVVNTNPSVTASAASASVCDGESTTITATATGGTAPYTYAWTPAAGLSSTTIASPTVVPPSTSNTYSVVVKDSKGCSSAATNVTVEMNARPAVTATASSSSICTGSTTTLTANAVGGTAPYSYTWTPAATLSSATDASPIATPTATGNTTYSVVVKDSKGCSSAEATTTISVTSGGAANVAITSNPAGAICQGTSVTFTANPTNGGNPTYQWKLNGNDAGTGATYTSNSLANNDKISVVMTSSISCVTGSPVTAEVTAVVNEKPSVTATATSAAICEGGSTEITATATGGVAPYNYVWTPTTGLSSGTNGVYTASPAATTPYSVVVTDSKGCSSEAASVTVTVNSKPAVTINPAQDAVCPGGSSNLQATVTGGTAPFNYAWTPASAGSTESVTVSPASTTTYSVVVTDANNCSSNSASATVSISSGATASVSITASTTKVCTGTDVTFTATPTAGGATPTYQWKVDGANVGTNVNTYTSSTLTAGSAVIVEMISSLACAGTTPVTSNTITLTAGGAGAAGSITGPSSVCSGASGVQFSITKVDGATSYKWDLPQGVTVSGNSNSNAITVKWGTVGGTVKVTPLSSCGEGASSSITVALNTTGCDGKQIDGPASVSAGGTYTYSVVNPTPGATYEWQLPPGSNCSFNKL